MGDGMANGLKDLWGKWNIRGLVTLSLVLQTILIFLSPNRKRTDQGFFCFIIWSAYLLANWAAEYAVGQISKTQGQRLQPKNNDLLAFWSTFLLLHLGGPDSITAFALEDNDLWLRRMFGLVSQAIVTLYVVLLSMPNNLLVPTSFMLVAGIIKYVERIKALHGASLETFKNSMLGEPDPGPDYAKFTREISTRRRCGEPTQILRIEEAEREQRPKGLVRPNRELTHLEVVQYAYKYFNIFKGFVVDLIFSSQSEQWNNGKDFFLAAKPEEALRVLEVELSFIYDTFYTKVDILHTWTGVAFRFMALAFLVSSLCIFTTTKKNDYNRFDVGLTYALLIGGIALDFVAVLTFCVSDWTFARLRKPKEDLEDKDSWVDEVLNVLLSFRKLKWKAYNCSRQEGSCELLDRSFLFRRWSEYIYAYNLIGYSRGIKPKRIHKTEGCSHGFYDRVISFTTPVFESYYSAMKQKASQVRRRLNLHIISSSTNNQKLYYALYPLKLFLSFWFGIPMINYFLEYLGISDCFNGFRYASRDRITKGMWEFTFEEVKRRAQVSDDAEIANEIYSARGELVLHNTKTTKGADVKTLLRSVTQVDYDQSILLWHIATELLFLKEEFTQTNQRNREFSKILSDYMMYLLILQPALMSTVAGIDKIKFKEAAAEAKKYWKRKHDSRNIEHAFEEIFSNPEMVKKEPKRYQRKSVLTDAKELANELHKLSTKEGTEVMWDVVSKVWVEMLCYGAGHCDPKKHVAQLSQGGEYITFVWILMAHFGVGDHFHTTEGNTTTLLIVDE
ncbi:unnamed protein product [Arabidopsis thaliana]|uniref:DUF4220 domain-containing protein n=1 Tax=Arabidopsis thaliana TaxID=3702 RepID=A0A654EHC7_ARATH|nr:unnamed protein product [Arabidopsis thaliana]